ncbi:putative alpha/beta hydrolase family protein [Staphylococcus hominis]|nr:putative alpha/beta hydrolase family protein [Staphylococcus hominis]
MSEDYKKLLGLKNIYKDNQDGMHFDVKISNSSSRPLKYLLGASPKTYKKS